MTDPQQRLLDRLFESPQFAHAASLKRILQYLCDHSVEGSLKEYDIALGAIGRPESFDPKIDPIVRVNISAIREKLRAYFDGPGRNELLRLSIPKGEYRAVFLRSDPEPSPSSGEDAVALRRFWDPYLSGGAANILIYTDLLFFRDDAGNYLRNIYVNDRASRLEDLQKHLSFTPSSPLRPSYHFLSAGEVHAMLSLVRLFERFRVPLESRNSRFSAWKELHRANLILLGSSRTNSFLDSLQGGSNFIINTTEILNTAPCPGEQSKYSGRRFMEGKLEKLTEYAVVTRCPGLAPGTSITMVAANHGRAIEGAGHFLTLEEGLRDALESSGLGNGEVLPAHFQLLLRVEMVDFDEEVIHVERVAHRVR